MSHTPLIAIVDDDSSIRAAVEGLLRASGFASAAYASAEDFLETARLHEIACLITDLQLDGMSGLQLHHHLTASGMSIPVIVITAFPADGQRALAAGAVCVLDKPVRKEDLLAGINAALQPSES